MTKKHYASLSLNEIVLKSNSDLRLRTLCGEGITMYKKQQVVLLKSCLFLQRNLTFKIQITYSFYSKKYLTRNPFVNIGFGVNQT